MTVHPGRARVAPPSMLKPDVLGRWTLSGRLRSRLSAIEARVRSRDLSRMAAGDRIACEVVGPLGRPTRPAERLLLHDAHFARARLYHESRGATDVEAAAALVEAAIWHREIGPDLGRSSRIATLALEVLPGLASAGSRRTRLRVSAAFLDAARDAEWRLADVERVLGEVPEVLASLTKVRESSGVTELLDALTRWDDDPTLAVPIRAAREAALRTLLAGGEARLALDIEERHRLLDADGAVSLALMLADANDLDERSCRHFASALRRASNAPARLEPSLSRAASIGPKTPAGDRPARIRLNEVLLPFFPHAEWPFRHLAFAAAHSGDLTRSLAAFAAALDRGTESALVAEPLAAMLFAAGFDGPARRLASPVRSTTWESGSTFPALAAAFAVAVDPARASECEPAASALARILRDHALEPGLEAILQRACGRLLERSGAAAEALRAFERAHALAPRDATIAHELAISLARCGSTERARIVVTGASGRLGFAAAASVEAEVLVAERRARDGLHLLVDAIRTHRRSRGSGAMERRLVAIRRRLEEWVGGSARSSPFLAHLAFEAGVAESGASDARDRQMRLRAADLASQLCDARSEARLLWPLARAPRAPEVLVARTIEACLAGGSCRRARLLVERTQAASSASPRLRVAVALVDACGGRSEPARLQLEAALAHGERRPAVLMILARLRAEAGRPDEALAALAGIPLEAPAPIRAHAEELAAAILERAGRVGDALARLQAVLADAVEPRQRARASCAILRCAARLAATAEDPRPWLAPSVTAPLPGDDDASAALVAWAQRFRDSHVVAEALHRVESATRMQRKGGDPVALRSELRSVHDLLPESSAARAPLRRACDRLDSLVESPSLASLSARLRTERDPSANDAVVAFAEDVANEGGAAAWHHLALLLTRRALALEEAEHPSAPDCLERAHAAWQRFFEHGEALSALVRPGARAEALGEAAHALRRHLVDVAVEASVACADRDPARAERYARMAWLSPLAGLAERDQVRCHWFLRMTEAPLAANDAAWVRRRLDVVLRADATNPDALRLHFQLEIDALATALDACAERHPTDEVLDRLAAGRAASACSIALIEDDDSDASDENRQRLAVWLLADALLAAFREADPARARRCASRASGIFAAKEGAKARWAALFEVLEARDPENDPFVRAEAAMSVQDWDQAETEIERAYRFAAHQGDFARSRAAIELRAELRRRRDAERSAELVRTFEAMLVAGRLREALEFSGGHDPAPSMPVAVRVGRIRALHALGRADRARSEAVELAVLVGPDAPEIAQLEALRDAGHRPATPSSSP